MAPKTINTAQLSLGISSHNNHYLFSDHYLNNILKSDPRWREAIAASESFLEWVTAVYQHEQPHFASYSEAQLEENWFRPILRRLGHTFEGQAKIPGLTSGVKYPDYVFFPDEASRQRAAAHQQSAAYVQDALAVGEVKKWDVPLGKKSQGTPSFENNNPSYQIDYYLRATDLAWGVLSNGRLWRLVHKESSYKLDVYFEIDLVQAIEEQNRAAAIFFVLFFGQGAFVADGHGQRPGRPFLQDALTASAAYTLELENDLRDNAYKALEHLIQGFIGPQANGLTTADLPTVYINSLYLLYRIIFLFYGESRGLLPLENEAYQKYSLTLFARDVAARLDSGFKAAPMTDEYWGRLKRLFTIINGSQPDLNRYLGVPRYNGGLFNPELHPFLERYFVGDRYLLAAIDVLARREVGQSKAERRRENVDYRTLGVRQLGSIYEGLLEYRPQQAAEPMVAVKKTKGEEWLPADQKPAGAKVVDTRNVGDIYLVTDKGERKATGSYYTPDYIVKYIVEQTLGPLVEQARVGSVRSSGFSRVNAAEAATTNGSFAREILQLNVLDPAMGSGHFLVEATDYLARAIATDEGAAPDLTGFMQPQVANLSGLEEDDLVFWRRQVVEACIYGVDKNPMAVELAKLSLWLVTVAKDKPLSFLDHHLRHGDSLVGARLADLNRLPVTRPDRSARPVRSDQPLLLDEGALAQDAFKAVGGMMAIEGMLSDSIEDIHHKERLLAQLDAHLAKWRRMADLWTSRFFGSAMSPEEYADLLRTLQGGDSALLNEGQRQHFLEHPAVTDNDYFHWELAFPELFFDEFGRHKGDAAGFDAVIGNPPYVRQEGMAEVKPFLAQRFQPVYDGKADLYVYFYQQSIDLLAAGGLTSYIVTNKWLRADYGEGLRGFLSQNADIVQVINFGHAPIFPNVDVFPLILLMRKGQDQVSSRNLETAVCPFPREALGKTTLEDFVRRNTYVVPTSRFDSTPWSLEPVAIEELMRKLRRIGIPLTEFANIRPLYGIKTGLNEAFVIDTDTQRKLVTSDPKSAEIIKPCLRGQDIKRWNPIWESHWLILAHKDIDIENYPAIKAHLYLFKEQLVKRAGSQLWWQLQASPSYYELFEKPKIIHTDITWRPQLAFTDEPFYLLNTAYMWPTEDLYLLAVANSPLLWTYMWRNAVHGKDEALRIVDSFVKTLPIAMPTDKIRQATEKRVVRLLSLTKESQKLSHTMLDWLKLEFGVEESGQKLSGFASLSEKEFLQEVKSRGSFGKPHFSPGETKILRDTHQEYGTQLRAVFAESNGLEHELSDLVNQAYELTAEEVKWLWRTAPPRMPIQPK